MPKEWHRLLECQLCGRLVALLLLDHTLSAFVDWNLEKTILIVKINGTKSIIAVSTTLSQLDLLQRLTASYPNIFSTPNLNSSSALAAFKKNGQLVSPIGIEGYVL